MPNLDKTPDGEIAVLRKEVARLNEKVASLQADLERSRKALKSALELADRLQKRLDRGA